MQQSKNVAIAFLLGAVVVGGALGFSADRYFLRDRIGQTQPARQKLADRLQLDSAQRLRLDSIRQRMDLAMAPSKDTIEAIRMRAREEIRAMLTPAQLPEFEKMLAELNTPHKNHDEDDN